MRKKKIKYSNIIYCYDIETSGLVYNEEHLQSTYLHGLSWMEYRPMVSESFDSVKNLIHYTSYRTYDEMSDAFETISNNASENDERVKIFVHNLSYEFEAMMRNVKFCYENFDKDSFIAVGTHQPLSVRCGNLVFVDSFKLLGCKSLETLGNEYNVPKLKDIKGGYKQKYYWWTDLPESEYIYNERDCAVVLYSVCRYMANFTNVKTVADISISNTSMIKREIRLNRDIASSQEVYFAQTFAKREFNNNKDFIGFIQQALAGGYTHANAYIVGKHIKDVYCYDATSMHPSAMWARKFGYLWKEQEPSLFNRLRSINFRWLSDSDEINNDTIKTACYNESIKFEKPIRYFYIATVTYKNIRVRNFPNCMYSYISSSKCENIIDGVYDNGKMVSANELTFTGCDIDFLLIDMLYEYDSCECSKLITATKSAFMQPPTRKGIKYYAKQKSGYKNLEKKIDNGTATLEDFTFEDLQLCSDEVSKAILDTNNKDIVHILLMFAKASLNGQYGCNAMKPLRAEIGLTGFGETMEWVDLGEMLLGSKNSINVFTDGLYTVAYSRLHLICFALYLVLECKVIPLYHDTDSLYFTNNSKYVTDCINEFNENILKNSVSSECYNFGIMDFDGHFNDFVTWGSKCYCATYIDKNGKTKVKATVAGASKKQLCELFTAIVDDEDFDYLIDEYFHPNISYDTSINKKLIRKCPGTRIVGDFIDEFGIKGHIDECSVTVLEECGYTLRSLTNIITQHYYNFCYRLRGDVFSLFIPETVSICNEDYYSYTKRFSEEQYEVLYDIPDNTLFQLSHKFRKELDNGQE